MKCVHCGITLDDNSRYCNACGAKTLKDSESNDIAADNDTAEFTVHTEAEEDTLSDKSEESNPSAHSNNEPEPAQQNTPQEQQRSYFTTEPPQLKIVENPAQAPRQSNISVEKGDRSKPLSLSQLWFIEVISLIPVIGFFVLCILALGGNFNQNRTKLAQAKLLVRFMLVSFLLLLAIWFLFMVNYYGTDLWTVLDSWLP